MMLEKVNNPIFLLCGDDINYWNEIKNDINIINKYEIIKLENETDINTFALLQQFYNYIMSNSSFLWWCVWLANSKNVIAPAKWFGPKGPKEYNDIYEKNWIRIE